MFNYIYCYVSNVLIVKLMHYFNFIILVTKVNASINFIVFWHLYFQLKLLGLFTSSTEFDHLPMRISFTFFSGSNSQIMISPVTKLKDWFWMLSFFFEWLHEYPLDEIK